MKRYALFTWQPYEAAGGWFDFDEAFDSVSDAVTAAKATAASTVNTLWHVVDMTTGEVIESAS